MVSFRPLGERFRLAKLVDLIHVHESPFVACDPVRGESSFA